MVVIDDMNPVPIVPATRPRMLDDEGGAQKGFDAVVIDMHPQTLANQLRRGTVEDAFDQKAAGPGDRNNSLGEVGGATCRQGAQMSSLCQNGVGPLPVASGHQEINEAPVIGDRCEVAVAAQDQRLCNGGLEMPVLRFHCTVLMGLTPVVAARLHAVVPDKGLIAQGNILTLVSGQVAEG